jgi:hypothetical protein
VTRQLLMLERIIAQVEQSSLAEFRHVYVFILSRVGGVRELQTGFGLYDWIYRHLLPLTRNYK